jgi:DUF4097 and DUF4098 domain-containing protein YvlB
MTRLLSPFVALFVTFALAAPAAAQRETETVDRTLSAQPAGTVRLKTFSGHVEITAGNDTQVVIHAVRRATRERLRDISLEITQSGSVITIDANNQRVRRDNENVVETDFEIRVPKQTALEVKTFSAPVVITGVLGPHVVDGFSGDIRLTDTAGPTRVKTFSGSVHLRSAAWRDGDEVDIKTFSGNVNLTLPDTARGELDFDSFSGHFDSSLPVTLQASRKRSFHGQLNGGGGTGFRLKTFSGSVTLGLAQGAR